MKITGNTTAAELEFEKARLGVTALLVSSNEIGLRIANALTADGAHTGAGATEADAIDAALAKVEARMGIDLIKRSRAGQGLEP